MSRGSSAILSGIRPLVLIAVLVLAAAPAAAQPAGSVVPPATQPLSAQTNAEIQRVRTEAAQLGQRPLGDRANRTARDSDASPTTNPATVAPRSGGIDFIRILSALAIVVGLIVAARVLFRRFFVSSNAPGASGVIKVIGRSPLAPRQQVLLLQVGGRIVVVGESNGSLSTLAQIEDPDEVARLVGQLQAEQIQRAASFGGLFTRVQRGYDEPEADASPAAEGAPIAPPTQAAALEEEKQINQAKSDLSSLVEKVRSLRSQLGS